MVPQGLLDTGIRVEHHVAGRVVDQADRQTHARFTTSSLGQLATARPPTSATAPVSYPPQA